MTTNSHRGSQDLTGSKNKRFWDRGYNTMQKQMLCSEHAAICYMNAVDKQRGKRCSTKLNRGK